MTKVEKLRRRFFSIPKDFTWKELENLLKSYGYTKMEGAGSRVVFKNERAQHRIKIHRPHPSPLIKRYVIVQIAKELKILYH